jgi:anti-sigma regulatory factor (Ser/Thr protein kinase)
MPVHAPPAHADLLLPRRNRSAGQARQIVAALVPADADVRDTGRLLVSEAVANAVEHACGAQLRVTMTTDGAGTFFCAVFDHDPRPPKPPAIAPDPLSENGRGLILIDELSTAWGILPGRAGKWIWFQLAPDTPVGALAASGD